MRSRVLHFDFSGRASSVASIQTMCHVPSLHDLCLRCVIAQLADFPAAQMSGVPYRIRYGLFRSLSLVDLWKYEDVIGQQVGVDTTRVWDEFVRDRQVDVTGLDFVHGSSEAPPCGKTIFSESLHDVRELCFQRLWNDLHILKCTRKTSLVLPVQKLLFSLPHDPFEREFTDQVPPELRVSAPSDSVLTRCYVRSFIIAVVQAASRARPRYLRHSSIMDYLKPRRNPSEMEKTQAIVKQLLSNVIAVNTPSEEIGEAWFTALLSNGMPTLKLCVHYDLFQYILSGVQKCAETKKLDELIIRLRDELAPILEISRFTEEVMKSHSPHLRLLEITSLHQPNLVGHVQAATLAKFATPLQWFLQQPHFTCLRLSGVIDTSVARSLVSTFLSTPCASPQRLELAGMYAGHKIVEGVVSLPKINDHYSHKFLLLDSIRMADAKRLNMNKYLLNSKVVDQHYLPNPANRISTGTSSLTSWLFGLPNLKVGSLEIFDYSKNCIDNAIPSTASIDQLKMFVVARSEEECIWTRLLFNTAMNHPVLSKCLWDLRFLKRSSRRDYYLAALTDVLLKQVPLGNLSILSITINKNIEQSAVLKVHHNVSPLSRLAFDIDTGTSIREKNL